MKKNLIDQQITIIYKGETKEKLKLLIEKECGFVLNDDIESNNILKPYPGVIIVSPQYKYSWIYKRIGFLGLAIEKERNPKQVMYNNIECYEYWHYNMNHQDIHLEAEHILVTRMPLSGAIPRGFSPFKHTNGKIYGFKII